MLKKAPKNNMEKFEHWPNSRNNGTKNVSKILSVLIVHIM